MRSIILLVLICILILSGCSNKNTAIEPDTSIPIETSVVTPNLDFIDDDTQIKIETPEELDSKHENSLNSNKDSVVEEIQNTPNTSNTSNTPILKEQTIENRLKTELSKSVDLEVQLKYPIGTDINNQSTKIKIIELLKSVSIVTDDTEATIEIEEPNIINSDEAIKLVQLILDIDEENESSIKIPKEKINNSVDKYRIGTEKIISIDDKDIILVEDSGNYSNLLDITIDNIIYNTDIITDLYNYTIYNWLLTNTVPESFYIEYKERVYRITFNMQEYNEYRYSWNGIDKISVENNHLDEINSLYIEDIGQYIKISMPKIIEGINPEFSYQFFISLYTNLLTGAEELSSSGSNEISCILDKDSYNSLIDFIVNTINELDIQHNLEYTNFRIDNKYECDESIHYKIATMSYLYNRLKGISESSCEVLEYKEGLMVSHSITYYENNVVTKYSNFEYSENLTKEQKRACSRLYELSNYSTTKSIRYDMNNLDTTESLDINHIIKNIKTYKVDSYMKISYTIKDNTMEEIDNTYKFLNSLTYNTDTYSWEFCEDNTINLILDISDINKFNNKVLAFDINIDNAKLLINNLGCTVKTTDDIINIICNTDLDSTKYDNILELAYRLSSNIFTKQMLLYPTTNTYKGIYLIREDGKVELSILNE